MLEDPPTQHGECVPHMRLSPTVSHFMQALMIGRCLARVPQPYLCSSSWVCPACCMQEVSVATITFTGRGAAELFGALAFHVLPEWRSIRRSKQQLATGPWPLHLVAGAG